jgi:signal transduction histidine kinase
MADQKEIRLINHVSSGIYLYADPMMVETILRNLVSNAIKFSYPGGKIVTHAVPDETDRATVCVSDQGAGLSEEDIRRLFLIDSKVRRKGTGGEEGSGLGLPLCNELIRLNKGTIRVESEPDKGSSFLFTLPLAFCEDELSHSPPKA